MTSSLKENKVSSPDYLSLDTCIVDEAIKYRIWEAMLKCTEVP